MKNSSKHMKPAPNYLDLPYSREIKMPYTEYMIPTSIRPSIFPYFLHSPTTKQPQKPQIQALKPKPAKSNWRSKFIISLPNKAFKKKQVLFNQSTGLSSSLLAKLSEPLLEKHFKAFKKTVPLEKFSKQGEIQETIQRVLKHEENIHKESSFLCSAVPSFSPGLSNRKRTQTSPGRIKSKRDIFDKHGLNTSKISMKSSVNFDIKGIVTKDKDKAFLEIYLNSFEDSPEAIRMKTSRFSKSPLLAPPIQNKEVESPKQATSRTLRPPITNKGEIEKHEEEGEVDSKEKEGKKRNDHNLIKILLHYWKFEKKVSKNRPPPPKKNVVWNRKINFSNVKKHLLELLLFLAKINISLDEFKNHKIFPDKPYEIEGSYIFLKSVKYGNLESVKAMVEKNKLYVLEYDYLEQTGLHWAAIKGYEKLAFYLIQKGSYIDHLDKSDRPPLYYAIRNGNNSVANLLLYHQASPWSTVHYDLKTLTEDEIMLSLLRLSRQIHMCLKFTPPRLRQLVWSKEKEKIKKFFPLREI